MALTPWMTYWCSHAQNHNVTGSVNLVNNIQSTVLTVTEQLDDQDNWSIWVLAIRVSIEAALNAEPNHWRGVFYSRSGGSDKCCRKMGFDANLRNHQRLQILQ